MARAQGARAQIALAFETTYGTPPVGGFTKMPFASTSLGAEQPLLNSELLGYGRDPLRAAKFGCCLAETIRSISQQCLQRRFHTPLAEVMLSLTWFTVVLD